MHQKVIVSAWNLQMVKGQFFSCKVHLVALFFMVLAQSSCQPAVQTIRLRTPLINTQLPQPAAPKSQEERQSSELLEKWQQRNCLVNQPNACLLLEKALMEQYPSTQAAAEFYLLAGENALKNKQYEDAIRYYERLLFYRPQHPQGDQVRFAYGRGLVWLGRDAEAYDVLKNLYDSQAVLGETTQRQLTEIVWQLAEKLGENRFALDTLVTLRSQASRQPLTLPGMDLTQIDQRLERIIRQDLTLKDAIFFWQSKQKDLQWQQLLPLLALKLAKMYAHIQAHDQAEALLNEVVQKFPDHTYTPAAKALLKQLQQRFDINTKAVGVLLPLSGKYRQYGERSLQAIQLAFASSSEIQLHVEDSQGEAVAAMQGVENLVMQHHVAAIIGPMFSAEALSASLKAEELAVPILSLSHRDGLTAIGSYVFRTALTVQSQAKALAHVAVDLLGFQRFAFLYPKSRYGQDFVQAFWDAIDSKHASVTGIEAYEPDQTTFREPIRRLVGRWFLNSRNDYRLAVDALRSQKLPPLRLKSELLRLEKNLAPIVDFDALIIPDGSRQIGLIAPALAFEDVTLTHDLRVLEKLRRATNNPNLKPVTLMGASTWNSLQTIDSCENYCESAIFVDTYFSGNPDPLVQDFIANFSEKFHGAQPFLSEAQAYDTGAFLRSVLQNTAIHSRADVRASLLTMPPYHGVTGTTTFAENGDAIKELYILTIQDRQIRMLDVDTAP